jgi:hypothetical protein
MKIKYKEPYWVKFQWDITEHHDNQYVTKFDKEENNIIKDFLHKENYIITCNFKIKNHYKKDDVSMVYGKPGKNLGLSYNQKSKTVAFEFWTTNNTEDVFNFVEFKTLTVKEIENGVTLSVARDKNKITVYKNFVEDNSVEFQGNLIDDYKDNALFIGCSSPDCDSEKHRYYGEIDINHFSILSKESDIEKGKILYESEIHNLLIHKFYDDVLCYYDFKTINNLGIIYDESKNTNFLEKVPTEYVK